MIDASASIRHSNPPDKSYDNWNLQLDFLTDLVDHFKIGPDDTRVGTVVFSTDAKLVFKLNTFTDAAAVNIAIKNITHSNETTNTAEAFKVAKEQCFNAANGDRYNFKNVVIFISDGRPEPDPDTKIPAALKEAQDLKDNGTIVFAIGVTNSIDVEFLREISSAPQVENQNYFTAPDFTVLTRIKNQFSKEACGEIKGEQKHSFVYLFFTLLEKIVPRYCSIIFIHR